MGQPSVLPAEIKPISAEGTTSIPHAKNIKYKLGES